MIADELIDHIRRDVVWVPHKQMPTTWLLLDALVRCRILLNNARLHPWTPAILATHLQQLFKRQETVLGLWHLMEVLGPQQDRQAGPFRDGNFFSNAIFNKFEFFNRRTKQSSRRKSTDRTTRLLIVLLVLFLLTEFPQVFSIFSSIFSKKK